MPKRYLKLLIYSLFTIAFLSILFINPKTTESFRMTFVEWTTPFNEILYSPFKEIKKIFSYRQIYDEHQRLKKDFEILRGHVILQEEFIQENKRLKSLLELKYLSKYPVVAANVVGRDPSNWTTAFIVNKGKKDGVKQGMPVVNYSSLIGKVLETGRKTSKVMLLTDPAFSVAALLQRSRDEGLIVGTLMGLCRMRYLSPQADVRIGDKVITSQLSSFVPEGLLIGEVVQILAKDDDSLTIECLVKPTVSPSQIEEVLIMKK